MIAFPLLEGGGGRREKKKTKAKQQHKNPHMTRLGIVFLSEVARCSRNAAPGHAPEQNFGDLVADQTPSWAAWCWSPKPSSSPHGKARPIPALSPRPCSSEPQELKVWLICNNSDIVWQLRFPPLILWVN